MVKNGKVKKPKETCGLATRTNFDYHGYNNKDHRGTWKLTDCMKNEYSYIHEHLMTLHFIATEFNCKNIVEVGTGMGESTLALALAALKTGGHVTTIDVEQCWEAKHLIEEHDLQEQVTFLEIDKDNIPRYRSNIDFLFIDGDHSKAGVLKDIVNYVNGNIEIGSWVVFHDTNNPKWKDKIGEAISICSLIQYPNNQARKEMYKVYEWLNCNGLTVLRKYE